MSQFRKLALTIGVQVLLWSHLIVYSGIHILQVNTFFSVDTEFADSGKDSSNNTNENSFGEEEVENEPFPHIFPFPVSFFSTNSIPGNSKKMNSFYSFGFSTLSLDILSPPPQG